MRKYLTKDELDRVLGELTTPYDIIADLQVHTGRRPSEVLQVKRWDIDHTKKRISFIQLKKRKKETRSIDCIPIYDKLMRYIRTEVEPSESYIFPSPLKNNAPLNLRSFQRHVSKAGEDAGIYVHPHMFRHSFAVQYLEKRINEDGINPMQALVELKNILGHVKFDTTMQYLSYISGQDSLEGLWE